MMSNGLHFRAHDPLPRLAAENPSGVAYRMLESGRTVTWSELELNSRRCAAMLLAQGLKPGDGIAVYLDNHPRYFEILWAAHRIGLYYTTISRHLKTAELAYILKDCGAKAVFSSQALLAAIGPLEECTRDSARYVLDGERPGWLDYAAALGAMDVSVALPETPEGTDFLYTSGTTGHPKGVKRALEAANAYFNRTPDRRTAWKSFDRNTVFLSTTPFYHAFPVRWNINVMRRGGTCVMMEKFDALRALEAIQEFRVTHAQWVPTMFIRMLRLSEAQRRQFDLSSMRVAAHTGAPCPVWVKEQMITWWGPVLYEFYAGTELVGRTSIDSEEWLQHKGSVGRPEFGQIHIVDENGNELPPGEPGTVYFSGGSTFEYHNDRAKTSGAYNERGWATYGDVGYVDSDGYLYLTDRLAHMIISGGVNIYPQETENTLQRHPAVADVAVIGVPNEDFGEEVKAVVQLRDSNAPSEQLAKELMEFCRERLSSLKCPRSIDFVAELPRLETGKLAKHELRRRYWETATPFPV